MSLEDENCSRSLAALPLASGQVRKLLPQVPGWSLENGELRRELEFGGFRAAVEFANRAADLAEQQEHHPDICLYYDRVSLALVTHKIGALSRNDFIMAARLNALAPPEEPTERRQG
jgi:4a-hydroxytetrahydrobiopterin dehydratase